MRGNVPVAVLNPDGLLYAERTIQIEKVRFTRLMRKAPQCSRDFGRRDRRTPQTSTLLEYK